MKTLLGSHYSIETLLGSHYSIETLLLGSQYSIENRIRKPFFKITENKYPCIMSKTKFSHYKV